jgi:hypothetical protein
MKRFIFFLAMISLLASCAKKIPFTNAIRDKYNLTADEIKSIQFYISDDIVLYKKESEGGRNTEEGKLVVKENTSEDRIIIKKGTPCVVTDVVGTNKLVVSFETNDKTLDFESIGNSEFRLKAETWTNGRGKITYGDAIYYASQGSGSTYLEFQLKKLKKYKSKDTVVKGRKID